MTARPDPAIAMSDIRSIVVHVDETAFCPARLRLAGRLADRFGATLTAVCAAPSAIVGPPAPGESSAGWAALVDARTRDAQRRAHENFAAFHRDHPQAAWQAFGAEAVRAAGGTAAILGHLARGADLAVVGQSGRGEERSDTPGTLPQDLVTIAGRPVLVVPHILAFPDSGRRIVVAWNDSREAARAVADALPFLRGADRVCVMAVGGAGMLGVSALDMPLGYLGRHGITADGEILQSSPGGEAGVLLEHAALIDADMLVMGGYGHGRLRELLLGGMTREMLTRLPLPVLMSH